jgi:hypothetical protein
VLNEFPENLNAYQGTEVKHFVQNATHCLKLKMSAYMLLARKACLIIYCQKIMREKNSQIFAGTSKL